MLEIEGLESGYGGVMALKQVNLRIPDGAMVALIGPNGAGKSTLLNTISGLIEPRTGKVTFDGRRISGIAPHLIARAGVVHVPEGRQVFAPLSVEENLDLGRMAAGGRAKARATVDDLQDVYTLFPVLAARKAQSAGSLSGGEQQMLALGRALMGRPRILLLDEPSLGLAPLYVKQVFAALAELNRRGLTVLVVEQNAKLALEVADSAYVLEQGRIVREGPTRSLIGDPLIVAHYLGYDIE